eukprot:scaffold80390_cov51-Phaeocystis_antarctica.AAC.1
MLARMLPPREPRLAQPHPGPRRHAHQDEGHPSAQVARRFWRAPGQCRRRGSVGASSSTFRSALAAVAAVAAALAAAAVALAADALGVPPRPFRRGA